MRNLTHRCTDDELMDDPTLSSDRLNSALDDISLVNKWLGGNKITVNAIKKVLDEFPSKKNWSIVDVGCGDGEMLRILSSELASYGYQLKLTGIDISEKGLARARKLSKEFDSLQFINKDVYVESKDDPKYDIVISTLTLHHIREENVIKFVKSMAAMSSYMLIINDLHRNKIAYLLYQFFSRIFIKSEVAKYDGLVSIASGFKREDLENYAQQLKLKNYKITWKWAFRYLWCIKNI